jgi:hypothetical protein
MAMAGRNPPLSYLVGLGVVLLGVVVFGTWYKTGLFAPDTDAAEAFFLIWSVGLALPFMAAGLMHDWDTGMPAQ